MASGPTYQDGTLGYKIKRLYVRFFPNSTTNPTWQGDGVASITHDSTGTWTITLQHAYYQCWGAHATVQSTSAAALYAQVGDLTGTTAASAVVVRVVNGSGSATDMTADDNNSVSVELVFNEGSA